MAEFTPDTNSRIATMAEPGVTAARVVPHAAPGPERFTGNTISALAPQVGNIVKGIGDAYQGYAQAELTGSERAADFVDQDTIDKLFSRGDVGPTQEELLDEELNLTTITALRKQGKISATQATLLATQSIKRVSNEFPGIAPQLRRRGANFFQSLGGRSVLQNTVEEDAAIAAAKRRHAKITGLAVDYGIPPQLPFEEIERRVLETNRMIHAVSMQELNDKSSGIEVRHAMGRALTTTVGPMLDKFKDMLSSPGSEEEVRLIMDNDINNVRQSLNQMNQSSGLQMSDDQIEGYMSSLIDYRDTVMAFRSGDATAKMLEHKESAMKNASLIGMYQSGLTPAVMKAAQTISGFGQMFDRLPPGTSAKVIRVLDKVSNFILRGHAGNLDVDDVDTAAELHNRASTTNPAGESKEDAKTREKLADDMFSMVTKALDGGVDGVGSAEWENWMVAMQDPAFSKRKLSDEVRTKAKLTIQREYEHRIMNAAQHELDKPLHLPNDDGLRTIPTRDALSFINDGINFRVEINESVAEGLDRPSMNALRERQKQVSMIYVTRLNNLIRAIAHLEGGTNYASVATRLQKTLDGRIKFDAAGQPKRAEARYLKLGPKGELEIENTPGPPPPIPGVITPKKGDRPLPRGEYPNPQGSVRLEPTKVGEVPRPDEREAIMNDIDEQLRNLRDMGGG